MQQIEIITSSDGDEVLNDLRVQIKQAMAEKGYSCLKLSVLASTSAETIRRFIYAKGGSMRLDIFARVCLALDLDLTTKPLKKVINH